MVSSLDIIIPPEIKNDDFFAALRFIARNAKIKTILEIGASSGEGSTEALAGGIVENREKPTLFTLEASKARFKMLATRYQERVNVKPYNFSSVGLGDFPNEAVVREFYRSRRTTLNANPEETVVNWLTQDIAYLCDNQIPLDGIARIKAEHGIRVFDFVLIDGSEFTGHRELELVYGANIIALDDIMAFKNFDNHYRLLNDASYEICLMNRFLRNGYSIFYAKRHLSDGLGYFRN
jgi:hypothetical protein